MPPLYTDINLGVLHAPAETGMDPAYANRTTTKRYRTTPLRGLVSHPPYFHDGSAQTLGEVVDHYAEVLPLTLTAEQRHDLIGIPQVAVAAWHCGLDAPRETTEADAMDAIRFPMAFVTAGTARATRGPTPEFA